MALDAQILLSILAHESDTGDLSRTLRATPATYALALTNGTGANQSQVVWSSTETIGVSGDYVPNVRSLADDRGTISFSAIKLIYVRNTGTVAVNMIGNGDWDGGPQKLPDTANYEIPAGGVWLATNPTAGGWVASGASEYVTIQNQSASASATIDILLIGEGTIT